MYTGGFDGVLTKTDTKYNKIQKKVDMSTMLHECIGYSLPTRAFIYHIHQGIIAKDIVVALETGHVMSINYKSIDKVRYHIHAHTNKIYHAEYTYFDLNILLTLSLDKTWCLWSQNDHNKPLMRISTEDTPNTSISLPSNRIIVGCVSNDLMIYDIKQI